MPSDDAPIHRAMILAAGLGTRMRPVTNTLPKPLVQVAGKALIDHIFDYCREGGVTEATVNVHYLADLMEAHARAVTNPRVTVSDERAALLDSGGGVKKALPFLGKQPFFILNADAIWIDQEGASLTRLKQHWDPLTMDILLLLADAKTATGWGKSGDFVMEDDGRLRRRQKTEDSPHVYAGAGIWKPALFADRPDVFSLNLLFDEVAAKGRLHGLPLNGVWMHVGTPEAIPEAEAVMQDNRS
ncbi:MAG: nucleotidyltransferase family protein [Beijerinckiaceae bacterium]